MNWEQKPLEAVATLQRGYDLPVQDRRDGTVPIFAANGVVGFHSEQQASGPGVVTGRSGSIGKVHYSAGPYWPLNTSLYVKNFHGNEPRYIYWLLRHMRLEQYHEGTGVPTLNRNVVHRELVPVPPLHEQRRIAAILDKAEALRAKRREAIAKLDQLLQSVFLDMFGDPVSNPKGWPTRRLDELTDCLDSLRRPVTKKDRASGNVPYYGANGLQGWIDRPLFNEPLVLVAEDGGHFDDPARGVAYRIDGPAWVNNHAHILRAKQHLVDTEYLHRALRHYDFVPFISGTTRAKLTQGQLNKAPLLLPPLADQKRFSCLAQALQATRAKSDVAETTSEALFVSLQSRAFSGTL